MFEIFYRVSDSQFETLRKGKEGVGLKKSRNRTYLNICVFRNKSVSACRVILCHTCA